MPNKYVKEGSNNMYNFFFVTVGWHIHVFLWIAYESSWSNVNSWWLKIFAGHCNVVFCCNLYEILVKLNSLNYFGTCFPIGHGPCSHMCALIWSVSCYFRLDILMMVVHQLQYGTSMPPKWLVPFIYAMTAPLAVHPAIPFPSHHTGLRVIHTIYWRKKTGNCPGFRSHRSQQKKWVLDNMAIWRELNFVQ